MLEIHQLKAGYDDKVIVEVPQLALSTGEHCLILGDSGSGKNTLLCTLAGLLTPLGGEVTVNGQNLGSLRGAVMMLYWEQEERWMVVEYDSVQDKNKLDRVWSAGLMVGY